MENNIFQCDVADCDKIFFDVQNLRQHVLENHADESYRKNAGTTENRHIPVNHYPNTSFVDRIKF